MKTIRWGIVGCGDVTEVKSGPAFQKVVGSELIAVMRRDAGKAADYARRHGVPIWYDDAAKLIEDPKVDAVYIATPPAMHEKYALMACAAGKPCYVEKPMARNGAEANRMVEAFSTGGLPLFVAYYRRAQPRFAHAKKMICSGILGSIKNACFDYCDSQMAKQSNPVPWRLSPEQSGGGLFFDLGSHALDLMDFFLGPLVDVVGVARNVGRQFECEDYVELDFASQQTIKGHARFQFGAGRIEDNFKFEGDKGNLQFSCFGTEPLVLQAGDGSKRLFEFPPLEHVQQPLIQAIVTTLLGKTSVPDWLSTGDTALRTQRVMDLAVESYYGGREDGFWFRPLPR